MSKFRFRLAVVLRVREAARNERRAALAEAYRVDDTLREQIGRIEVEVRSLQDICRQAAGPGDVEIDRLVQAQRYEAALKNQQLQIARQRETVAAEIGRRRQALLEADRDVRVLEKLRERQAAAHEAEDQRREARRLDEVAQQQAMREAAR